MTPPLLATGVALVLAGAAVLGLATAAGEPAPPVAATQASGPSAPGAAPADTSAATYVWPTAGPAAVLRAFDGPAVAWAAGHRGVDLALAPGSPVLAAGAGVVAFAGVVVDRPVVSVQHADGLRTTYEPLVPAVQAGQAVAAGDVIGHLAAAPLHCPAGCLHWGARLAPEHYVDPLTLLRPLVVRLYPDS